MGNTLETRVKQAMAAKGMKPADLARASSSTTATISNWRNGMVVAEHVKAEQLFRIADALEVDGRWLLTGEYGPLRVNESGVDYPASQVLQRDVLKIAIQLVRDVLAEGKKALPPAKEAEAIQLAYELLEEGLPQAKVLRFVLAAVA